MNPEIPFYKLLALQFLLPKQVFKLLTLLPLGDNFLEFSFKGVELIGPIFFLSSYSSLRASSLTMTSTTSFSLELDSIRRPRVVWKDPQVYCRVLFRLSEYSSNSFIFWKRLFFSMESSSFLVPRASTYLRVSICFFFARIKFWQAYQHIRGRLSRYKEKLK